LGRKRCKQPEIGAVTEFSHAKLALGGGLAGKPDQNRWGNKETRKMQRKTKEKEKKKMGERENRVKGRGKKPVT